MKKCLNILIAEDEFVIRETIKLFIEELNHTVVAEAVDGVEAVDQAIAKDPDLIIMDINMPKLNGLEAIKQINKKKLIPIIIVSAYHDDKLLKQANEEGVLYYLLKPIDVNELRVAITITMNKFSEFKSIQAELHDTKKSLEARKYIEQAKGILMDKLAVSEPVAMKRLQEMSRNKNKKIVVIAQEIIEANKFFTK